MGEAQKKKGRGKYAHANRRADACLFSRRDELKPAQNTFAQHETGPHEGDQRQELPQDGEGGRNHAISR